jgi:apolipoprotein D and lipocalin family protein
MIVRYNQRSRVNFGFHLLILFTLLICQLGCSTIPAEAKAVQSFDKARYLGKWYEIARLDFKFERDLNNTTAEYSLNANGTIKVDNKGYNIKTEKWKQAIGKAKFVGEEDVAMLKVSFFGPFYGGYNVIALDDDYQYVLIAGGSLDNLWILSRKTTLPEDVKVNYLQIAEELGYKTSELLWVEHNNQQQE